MSVLIMLSLLLGANPDRPDLAGRVANQAGEPVRGASVFIYTAAARVGINPYCPSCYADCAKSAKTDDAGTFVNPGIRALAPERLCQPLEPRAAPRLGRPQSDWSHDPLRKGRLPVDTTQLQGSRVPEEVSGVRGESAPAHRLNSRQKRTLKLVVSAANRGGERTCLPRCSRPRRWRHNHV
jgi:hypothetical protein